MTIIEDPYVDEIDEKKEERKEKIRRVFIYIGVICLIALIISIPLSWYLVNLGG